MDNNIQLTIDLLMKNKEAVLNVLEQLKDKYGIDIDTAAMDEAFGSLEGKLESIEGTEVDIDGDASGAVDAAGDAESAVGEVPEEHETKFKGDGANLQQTITAVSTAYMAFMQIADKIKAQASELITLSGTQEKAEKLLQVSIENTGNAAEGSFEKYKDLAASIQEVTTIGDETTMAVMRLGLNMGVMTDDLEDATKGAIGLSKSLDLDLKTAMKMHTLAMQKDFTMLQRYLPALKLAKDDAEKMAIVKRAEANGWNLATSETETGYGALEQYSNIVGDLKEKLGALITSAILPFVKGVQDGVNILNDMFSRMAETKEIDAETKAFEENAAVLEILWQKTNKTATEKEVLHDAVSALQSQYPEYLSNIDIEKTSYVDLTTAIDKAREALENKIIAQMAEAEKTDHLEKITKLRLDEKELIKKIAVEESRVTKRLEESGLAQKDKAKLTTEEYISYGNIIMNLELMKGSLETNLEKQIGIREEIKNIDDAYGELIRKQVESTDNADTLLKQLESFADKNIKVNIEYDDEVEIDEDDGEGNDEEIIQREADKLQKIFDLRAEYRNLNRGAKEEAYLAQFEEGEAREIAAVELEQQRAIEQAERLGMHEFEMAGIVQYYENLKANIRDKSTKNQIKGSKAIKKALVKMNKAIALSAMESADAHKSVGENAQAAATRVVLAKAKEAVATQIAKVVAQIPFPFNVPAAAAAGAVMGVLVEGAINSVSKIKAAKGTVLRGPSHAQGGINIGNVEAEGGEPILTKGTSQDPFLLAMLSLINQQAGGDPLPGANKSSMNNGGISPRGSTPAPSNNDLEESFNSLELAIKENRPIINVTIETTDPEARVKQIEEVKGRMQSTGDNLLEV
jgi:hypothetical protein